MLQIMPQTAPAVPSTASSTFAGMLAALASRPSAASGRTPASDSAWNDNELADDVATLSYERALRTHARYHAPQPAVMGAKRAADASPLVEEAIAADTEPAAAVLSVEAARDGNADAAVDDVAVADDGNRKSASITIRLSRTECEQLRKRAAEAGLTVSAYLRSCTIEAESLRAMVKDTLAQLRSGPDTATAVPGRRNWRKRLGSWWPHWHHRERAAQA